MTSFNFCYHYWTDERMDIFQLQKSGATLQLENYVCTETWGIITSTLNSDILSVGGKENAFLRRGTAALATARGPETEVH